MATFKISAVKNDYSARMRGCTYFRFAALPRAEGGYLAWTRVDELPGAIITSRAVSGTNASARCSSTDVEVDLPEGTLIKRAARNAAEGRQQQGGNTMSARNDTIALQHQLTQRGILATFYDANTLRRAQLALHRWAELECGDGNDYQSWAIERDEQTDLPYFVTYPHTGPSRRRRIADKEKGALRRVADVCKRIGAHYYHQSDPRGCALYVGREPLPSNNYTHGVACCSD